MNNKLNIRYVEKNDDRCPLYVMYYGQTNPQSAHLYLDLLSGEAWLAYNAEIGNAVTADIWNGVTLRWEVPNTLTVDGCNQLLDDCAELLQRILDGSDIIWDGNNHIGKLDNNAQKAYDEIGEIPWSGKYETAIVYTVREFLEDWSCADILTATVEEIETVARELGVTLCGDIESVLLEMQDAYKE